MSIVFSNDLLKNEKENFKFIIKNYILKLLGLSNKPIFEINNSIDKNEDESIFYSEKKLIFRPYPKSKFYLYIDVNNGYEKLNYQVENQILRAIVSYFKDEKNYKSLEHYKLNIQYILQETLINAITKSKKNKIYELITTLEHWSTKTYEGKKVPFAFLIDSKKETQNNKFNYLEFLNTDFSATISDGISSIIKINENCEFIEYLSITDNIGNIKNCENIDNKIIPLRFTQVLANYVIGDIIGIFLLINGDILLAKNKEINYVKRNGVWANYSVDRFVNSIKSYENENNIISNLDMELLRQIYATSLDVSFSHSGGIIAIVDNHTFSTQNIIDNIDNYSIFNQQDQLSNENDEKNHDNLQIEFEKKLKKRETILKILNINNTQIKFIDIDRKLRSELVGLDGATIIDYDGKVISFGAIIQNECGSSSGGRGAAAKTLSKFGGLAIKISTDGYIELYIDGFLKYEIKY